MVFPETFFASETRDGFIISSMMKRAWAAELEVLGAFHDLCEAHGFRYYFAYGSLLGVVRHGGYVPWDDDIDLWMFREDMMRMNALPDSEFASRGLVLINSHHEEGNVNLAWRVDNGRWVNLSPEHLMKYHLCPFATGVDIHALDTVPSDPAAEHRQDVLIAAANTLSRTWEDPAKPEAEKKKTLRWLEEEIGAHPDEGMPVRQRLMILSDLAMALHTEENSGLVAFLPSKQKSRTQLYERAWFGEPVYMPFEGLLVPVPERYNLLLTRIFGADYMNPRHSGGMHGYPFYRKQYDAIKQLFEKQGETLPEFLSEA